MSVEDIAGGVLLTYDAPTSGLVGATWLYEFTTTARAPGVIAFDVSINASHGFSGTLVLQTLHNGSVVRTLARSTDTRVFSMTFPKEALILDAGDTWGIGVIDGSVPGQATAEIMVTVP